MANDSEHTLVDLKVAECAFDGGDCAHDFACDQQESGTCAECGCLDDANLNTADRQLAKLLAEHLAKLQADS